MTTNGDCRVSESLKSLPNRIGIFMRTLIERVPNSDKAVFSVHCHNDLGMAVANSLAGIAGGARQVECTINGIGERAGNAALEEVVMAINVRNDKFPYWNKIDTTMLTRASKTVSAATSFPVQYNKAIVGRNAFAHESGIHQDGVLKDASTYEIMCHPPVGLNLYVASGIAKMGITELTVAVWPWLLTMLIFLGMVTYIPEISLWLPRTLGML